MYASNNSIPQRSNFKFKRTLPKEILELIKLRKKARLKWAHTKKTEDKTHFNYLSRKVKTAIEDSDDLKTAEFIKSQGPNPISSKPFWDWINTFRTNKSARGIPCLVKEGRVIEKDEENAEEFREILADRFSDKENANFNKNHKSKVDIAVSKFLSNTEIGTSRTVFNKNGVLHNCNPQNVENQSRN